MPAPDSSSAEPSEALRQIHKAFSSNDANTVRTLLDRFPDIKAKINEPVLAFDSPAITTVRSQEMLNVLLDAGADINAKSRWWAGGFGLLHSADPTLARYAIERGAIVDVHAAARLGMLERLRQLVLNDPSLIHARGGDGQTPLHFANSVPVAEFLLDHGANMDRKDVDHESTPAQYMVADRQNVARYLVARGCRTDLLMGAALGDQELVRKHLDADPESIRMRVSDEYFPMINQQSGGTIYQWTLGWYVSAHDVAQKFGHAEVLELLYQRSPPDLKLLVACWAGNEEIVDDLLRRERSIIAADFPDASRRQIAHAARNNNLPAVRLMLKVGLPVDARGQHRATPLHWAAWHGNAEMVRAILSHQPPLENSDNDFHGTPLQWAIHGSENGWYCRDGDYVSTVQLLMSAGAHMPEATDGTEAVKEALRRHRK